MKLSKLNYVHAGFIIGFFTFVQITACNNSKEPDKTTTMNTDTTATASTTGATGKTVGKKIGKVAASMMSSPADRNVKMAPDKMGYYNYTEVAPVYPGGQGSLEDYINNNIEYPQDAIDNDVEGTVSVMFTIDENGKVANVKTAGAKLGHGLEEEAIRVVTDMPKWTPGTIKGKSVKAWYTIPLTYRLES